MALQDDLATIQTNVDSLKDQVDKLVAATAAPVTPEPTPADHVLDTVVTTLKGYGYEITPPPATPEGTPVPDVPDAPEGTPEDGDPLEAA
jgi:hypothetical protein